jgi:N-acetylmuramoyl-L-alanine amidase
MPAAIDRAMTSRTHSGRASARLVASTMAAGFRRAALGLTVLCLTTSGLLGVGMFGNVNAEAIALGTEAVASQISIQAHPERTTFAVSLSVGVAAQVYTLANPYRVIIDLPDVSFQLPAGPASLSKGLVTDYRMGLISPQQTRIVIDTSGPVLIEKAEMTRLASSLKTSQNSGPGGNSSQAVRLAVSMTPSDKATFGNGTGAAQTASVDAEAVRPALFDGPPGPTSPGSTATNPKSLPVIVIDPGHGGIDPGAIGPAKTTEKSVVLAVARQLEASLTATNRYRVVLTRSTDVFIPLDKRVQISEAADADLFISLHADAISERGLAQNIRGASVYTLSERASDDQSRLMAEKENASDLLAGMDQSALARRDDIKSILFDLLARENAVFSHDVSAGLVQSLAKVSAVAREPQRAAAFRVLKQGHSPAVLIELGFLSHAAEEQAMASAPWQAKIAGAIANAVDTYFARRKSAVGFAVEPAGLGHLPP